ncbi:hypothetical protein CAEBREN_31220 [Caenorhabditis brenneri]|uniref:Uncharacterized protein n=1 Tax=Caenorhabditis brenneri TaxID=135651 RepID=G0NXX3_CAEBE|nr:hypothetical protein CAEBREN_31220 [Caenorhabditis brenneri]
MKHVRMIDDDVKLLKIFPLLMDIDNNEIEMTSTSNKHRRLLLRRTGDDPNHYGGSQRPICKNRSREKKKKKLLSLLLLSSSVHYARECANKTKGETGPFLFFSISLLFLLYPTDFLLSTPTTLRKTTVESESMDEWSSLSPARLFSGGAMTDRHSASLIF